MTRRKLITLLGILLAAPVARPFAVRADKMRRIGILVNFRSDDTEGQNRLAAFVGAMQKLGWTEGTNVNFEVRWAGDDADLSRRDAEELIAVAPDVLLASGSLSVATFQRVDPRRTDCFCECNRSCRRRLRQQPGTARGQHNRISHLRIQHKREMA
jgi:putative ABC transport system substrate-binding protein